MYGFKINKICPSLFLHIPCSLVVVFHSAFNLGHGIKLPVTWGYRQWFIPQVLWVPHSLQLASNDLA